MLTRFSEADWAKLTLEWEAECAEYKEDFGDYAVASLPVLDELARAAPRRDAAVYGLSGANGTAAVCQANSTFLPGYNGKVLRIRHIILAPRIDFSSDIDLDDYGSTLVGVFSGALALAHDDMPSDHIKFHLKSPAEQTYGRLFTEVLQDSSEFESVAFKGSWIYLSKS